jgi:hypothetical protein
MPTHRDERNMGSQQQVATGTVIPPPPPSFYGLPPPPPPNPPSIVHLLPPPPPITVARASTADNRQNPALQGPRGNTPSGNDLFYGGRLVPPAYPGTRLTTDWHAEVRHRFPNIWDIKFINHVSPPCTLMKIGGQHFTQTQCLPPLFLPAEILGHRSLLMTLNGCILSLWGQQRGRSHMP